MIIQEAGLDFGLVQIGTICETFITIENISNLQVKWTLQPLSHKVNEKFVIFFYVKLLIFFLGIVSFSIKWSITTT